MTEQAHAATDHPELDDPAFLKEILHSLVHRVEFLESLLLSKGELQDDGATQG